jgi:hypothetical protein
MTIGDIQDRLDALLVEAGCRRYTAAEARADAAECWREICADAIAHGESPDAPFFNFVVSAGVGVFTFFGPQVELYVVRGDEWGFRTRFDPLAMVDVVQSRQVLADEYSKVTPDLVIDESLTAEWLRA